MFKAEIKVCIIFYLKIKYLNLFFNEKKIPNKL